MSTGAGGRQQTATVTSFYALRRISHGYMQGGKVISVLRAIDLVLSPGEMVALAGPSGSGKSTLLHIAGLLDKPQSGEVILAGKEASHLSDAERTTLRGQYLGFVYQFHHLLSDFTALENICIPQLIVGASPSIARQKAHTLLHAVNLSHRASHKPSELSGGEQQRVAIARALANDPQVLLADEPTGNLDESTGRIIFELLQKLSHERGLAVIMATHNLELAKKMNRTLHLHEGQLMTGAA